MFNIFNKKSEDGITCLMTKVKDSVKYDFNQWETSYVHVYSYVLDRKYATCFIRKSEKVDVHIADRGIFFSWFTGELHIDELILKLNHKECKQFLKVWVEAKNAKRQLKKDEVLSKWGCK